MEAADFVADSDEDEQEMLEALALAEEQHTRRRLEARSQEAAASPEKPPPTVQEQVTKDAAEDETVGAHELDQEATDGEQEEPQQLQQDAVLNVGDVVVVDARTWPGINKLGGSGRVVRVHREKTGDAGAENIFYDVRYVLGGFEKHVESEYVHSSKILEQHSNRKPVDRDYYHDDYINEPHRRKQLEAEKRREMGVAQPERREASVMQRRKRKRTHRPEHVEREPNRQQDDALSSGDDRGTKHKGLKIDEHAFVLPHRKNASLEESSRPLTKNASGTRDAQSPQLRQPITTQRRRRRMVDSSGEESSEDSDKESGASAGPERVQWTVTERSVSPPGNHDDNVRSNDKSGEPVHRHRPRKQHKTHRRRFVGGYERLGEDRDADFIQPEGNPNQLPEDVIRQTGIKLAKTKESLMVQLQEIFAQQQKHMDNFHEEQKIMNQKMKNLEELSSDDLKMLHKKVRLPVTLESLEYKIDDWQRELNNCSPWVRDIQNSVENELVKHNEEIPVVESARAAYSSDSDESSYSTNGYDSTVFVDETASVNSVSDELAYSYDYEPEKNYTASYLTGYLERGSNPKQRALTTTKSAKQFHSKKVVTTTTIDDYFTRQGSNGGLRSNLRLIGKQKISPTDPRWNWAKMARRKQRVGGGRSAGVPTPQYFTGFGSTHDVHDRRQTRRDDSASIQIQRLHLRDKRYRSKLTHQRSRETFIAYPPPQAASITTRPVLPAGIPFDHIVPTKLKRSPVDFFCPTIPMISRKERTVRWEAVFDVVSDDDDLTTTDNDMAPISLQQYEVLLAFGHPISGPLTPRHLLFCDDQLDTDDCEMFHASIRRRSARLRQLLNDLRLEENSFMESLSRGELGIIDEEGFATVPEWISLVSLEERYHTFIASFAAQVQQAFQAMETLPSLTMLSHLRIILDEVAALIRQLPDCGSLFGGCKSYFFFIEVASRDAVTTPLLTAISRAYWYCLNILLAAQTTCSTMLTKQEVDDLFLKSLPVNRVTLAVVLFLFDLFLHLPSSHRLGNPGMSNPGDRPLPALSLWLLIRDCSTSAAQTQGQHDMRVIKETHFWALVQAVYQQRYFDELARCYLQKESAGGYLRDFTPKTFTGDDIEYREEILESQLLALESSWELLAVLTRIVVKQLWRTDPSDHPTEDVELPKFLKQFAIRCKELGNSRLQLAAFVESSCGDDEIDFTTTLCRIIWTSGTVSSPPTVSKQSGTDWNWGPKNISGQQPKAQEVGSQQDSASAHSAKVRPPNVWHLLNEYSQYACLRYRSEQAPQCYSHSLLSAFAWSAEMNKDFLETEPTRTLDTWSGR
ncbi:unnamed protein product [Phytophthora fragariaefolia]|uniref:Unnamed protein product n=1 Tax=Phytophthora fragariaefolia TaxID=1490495 RepID=A0A9W7D071_9STRA|nr:unnamed protein product [Phytophthora fragariaefolia]